VKKVRIMSDRMTKQSLELVWQLAKTDFKIRYNGSVLGYVWALLKPLLIFLILNFIFSNIFGGNIKNYSVNLLTGIILWTYFAEGTTVGMLSLLSKANLITKIRVSKLAIVFASTVNSTITFLINLIILALLFIYFQVFPTFGGMLLALLFFLLIYILIVGFSFLTAPLFLRYRDLNQVWEVLLTLGFYASPIIYPLTLIPAHYQPFLWLNPMSYIIHYSKLALIDGQFISLARLGVLVAVVGGVLALGLIVLKRMSPKVAETL
jgi:ABC-type polysaccharide/polyol phosphate export permease